jgi:hypothetical protein
MSAVAKRNLNNLALQFSKHSGERGETEERGRLVEEQGVSGCCVCFMLFLGVLCCSSLYLIFPCCFVLCCVVLYVMRMLCHVMRMLCHVM